MQKYGISLLFLLFLQCIGQAQSLPTCNKKVEWIALGGVSAAALGAKLLENQLLPLSSGQLLALRNRKLPEQFLGATTVYNSKIARQSDYLLLGTCTAAGLSNLLFPKNSAAKYRSSLRCAQGAATTILLIESTKIFALRARPYTYASAALPQANTRDARLSFVSGHAGLSAFSTFYIAGLYQDYYPDSQWRIWIWTSAAVLPALVGMQRVQAGKHFPSDVITGYLLGAGVALLNREIHRNCQ